MGWRTLQRIHLSVDTAAIYQSIPDDVSQLRISGDVYATGTDLLARISYDGGATYHIAYVEAWLGQNGAVPVSNSTLDTNAVNLCGASGSPDLNPLFTALISVGSAVKVPAVQTQQLIYRDAGGLMNFSRSAYSTQRGRMTNIMLFAGAGNLGAGTSISIEGC